MKHTTYKRILSYIPLIPGQLTRHITIKKQKYNMFSNDNRAIRDEIEITNNNQKK